MPVNFVTGAVKIVLGLGLPGTNKKRPRSELNTYRRTLTPDHHPLITAALQRLAAALLILNNPVLPSFCPHSLTDTCFLRNPMRTA